MILKIVYEKQIHIYVLEDESTFQSLSNYIEEVFNQLPANYQLVYYDDLDEITLGGQMDLDSLKLLSHKYEKMFIKIKEKGSEEQGNKSISQNQSEIKTVFDKKIQQSPDVSFDVKDSNGCQPQMEKNQDEHQRGIDDQINSVQIKEIDQTSTIAEKKSISDSISQKAQSQIEPIKKIDEIIQKGIKERFEEQKPDFTKKIKKSLNQISSKKISKHLNKKKKEQTQSVSKVQSKIESKIEQKPESKINFQIHKDD